MKPITGLRQKPNKRLVRPEQHERRLAFWSISVLESADEPPGIQSLLGPFLGIVQLADQVLGQLGR